MIAQFSDALCDKAGIESPAKKAVVHYLALGIITSAVTASIAFSTLELGLVAASALATGFTAAGLEKVKNIVANYLPKKSLVQRFFDWKHAPSDPQLPTAGAAHGHENRVVVFNPMFDATAATNA